MENGAGLSVKLLWTQPIFRLMKWLLRCLNKQYRLRPEAEGDIQSHYYCA